MPSAIGKGKVAACPVLAASHHVREVEAHLHSKFKGGPWLHLYDWLCHVVGTL
jgi:hypothetical protein